jgi:hypothetical protein
MKKVKNEIIEKVMQFSKRVEETKTLTIAQAHYLKLERPQARLVDSGFAKYSLN